jgi:hypothetical protein
VCGAIPTRLFIQGRRCRIHTPAALAGEPEPGQKAYCPPGRCLCGRPECPAFATFERRDRYLTGETVVDARAKASGKRRSSLEDYRSAQATVGEHRERERHLRLVQSDSEAR